MRKRRGSGDKKAAADAGRDSVPFRFIRQRYDTAYMAELEARRPPNSTPSSEPVPH